MFFIPLHCTWGGVLFYYFSYSFLLLCLPAGFCFHPSNLPVAKASKTPHVLNHHFLPSGVLTKGKKVFFSLLISVALYSMSLVW